MAEKKPGQVRVMLWMIPRTLSTAFLKAMSHLDNVKIISEPYTCAMTFGPDRIIKGHKEMEGLMDTILTPAARVDLDMGIDHNLYTFKWVKEALLEGDYPGKDVVFCKDMSQPIATNLELIPKGYRHTFMIRHPLKLFKSWNNMFLNVKDAPNLTIDQVLEMTGSKGYGYGEHLTLYEHLKSSGIEPDPVIIDADDLQTDPEGVLRKYCDAVGIKYTDKLLNWEAGDGVVNGWAASKLQLQANKVMGVYQNAFDSTCFKKPDELPSRSELSESVLKCVDATMPIYEQMYEKRLRP